MTTEDGVPLTPGHLYTWLDIDAHFAALAARGQWEPWLWEVDAYWDGVDFTVADRTDRATFWPWLVERLGPLTVDSARGVILLESVSGDGRPLDVRLRFATEPPQVERVPRWNERRIVRQLAESLPPPDNGPLPHGVRICAFHSFKGGVGRTLHCLALACELVRPDDPSSRGQRVLLVEADIEAPGISWMIAAQGNRLDFALDDLLALLQGAGEGGEAAVALARKFLVNQERDGVIVLPTTRDAMRTGPPRIEPIDLLVHHRPPYFFTEMLARVAHEVGASTVLIDLRAGASELSAPILLDPRVQRVFVTTISEQSVRGTVHGRG